MLKELKSLKAKKSYGCNGISSEVLKLGAEVLCVPLTYIINFSILTGKYPSEYKISKVVPVFKKGYKKSLQNYRPVALLCVSGMLMERIVSMQIEDYFEKNNLLGEFQFGFRKNKSTISELLTLFDKLLEAKEEKKEIIVLLYDLSAAFDTVSHEVLLTKLQIYGFDNQAMNWIRSYLENRRQIVTLSGKTSNVQKLNFGTPQGSRLSPLLFICLMADLDLWVQNSFLSNFADDTQSIIVCNKKEELLETTTQEANKVMDFFRDNNLVNNPEKAAVLYNSGGKGKSITLENIGGKSLISTNSEKLLGIHINSDFTWETHIEKIIN